MFSRLIKLDVEGGEFADMDKIQPINLQGNYYASRGPLLIPPSEQGQPVIFQAGGGNEGLEFGGGDDIKVYTGFMFSLVSTEEEALERRRQLMSFNPEEIPSRVSYLGSMVGLPLSVNTVDIDQPLATD